MLVVMPTQPIRCKDCIYYRKIRFQFRDIDWCNWHAKKLSIINDKATCPKFEGTKKFKLEQEKKLKEKIKQLKNS